MHALIIDLNNFSRYPTLSVGYLVSILRHHNITVDVLSPFAKDVVGYPRTVRASRRELYYNFLKHWSAVTPNKIARKLRNIIQNLIQPGGNKDKKIILLYLQELLKNNPDVVLISAYTMYADICRDISEICAAQNIPVIIGGSYFVEAKIASLWNSMPGISAVYAGEPELELINIISSLVNGKDISHYPGIYVSGMDNRQPAPPLEYLDRISFPDFSDFPWGLYPNRIIPLITGRGCEWGHCTFCSDVIISSGRTFRSRGIDDVMEEIVFQGSRFNTNLFVFLDLKLNSDLYLWREMIARFPNVRPKAKWTASIHVDNRSDNGLSRKDLHRAHAAGLVRITCGLESGSPKVLKLMAKGTNLKRLSTFLKDAHEVGLSVRLTCIVGYPGEEPEDVDLTAQFIEDHSEYIERIVLNRFSLMPGTRIDRRLKNRVHDFPHIKRNNLDPHTAIVLHENKSLTTNKYYIATFRLMRTIHKINRQPLRHSARKFEGVM